MARAIAKLSALAVTRAKAKGMLADGGGLYVQITGTGAKTWLFCFNYQKKPHEMGLGPVHAIPLKLAREKATDCRRMLAEGINPLAVKREERERRILDEARTMTFKACADAYIAAHEAAWRNEKHVAQWRSTIDTYAGPAFGKLPVQDVDVALVMKVIEPLWQTKTETASRLRGRIESVLDWATVRNFRKGENPARWKGHLENLLPKRAKVQKVEHHPALPYKEIGAFMAEVRKQKGMAALALEFAILTAARTGEVIGATWDEVDVEGKTWVVPAGRIKAGKEHRVPLSPAALAILTEVHQLKAKDDGYVFPGGKEGRPLSNMALLQLLKRMKRTDLTAHGFRSTFRDWAAEQTDFPSEVVEMALAHTVSDKVEAAYRRGDMLEKRVKLMEAWAGACG